MKKNVMKFFSLIALAVLFINCSNDDGGGNLSPAPIRSDILGKKLIYLTTVNDEAQPEGLIVLTKKSDNKFILKSGENSATSSFTGEREILFDGSDFLHKGLFLQYESSEAITVGELNYPAKASKGQKLRDTTFRFRLKSQTGGETLTLDITYDLKNRRVMELVKLDTPLGKLDCYIVKTDVTGKINSINGAQPPAGVQDVVMTLTEYFCPSMGLTIKQNFKTISNVIDMNMNMLWIRIDE